jgi:transcriptional antiterminator NusG
MTIDVRDGSDSRWFALRVRSGCEKIVENAARNKGFEVCLPLYRCRHRWSDRVKTLELPLFPGYIFCNLNPEYRLPLLTIPAALYLVGVGKTPVPIDDGEISAIRAATESILPTEPWPFLEAGQRVVLEDGPLAGLEGLLIDNRKQQRLVVSVSLLMRSVAVEIEREWVRPLNRTGSVSRLIPVPEYK